MIRDVVYYMSLKAYTSVIRHHLQAKLLSDVHIVLSVQRFGQADIAFFSPFFFE